MKHLLLFAPGAGAPSSHPWMQNWKDRLTEIGDIEVFDYAYMREGRKRPDPLPRLIAGTFCISLKAATIPCASPSANFKPQGKRSTMSINESSKPLPVSLTNCCSLCRWLRFSIWITFPIRRKEN